MMLSPRSAPRLSATTRILVLVGCLLAVIQAQQCEDPQRPTPIDALGPFYVENSALTSRVGPESMLSDPTLRLQVNGRVLSAVDCNVGLAGISVELWYAGAPDGNGNFYQDDEYRGQVVTDECGKYSFTQTFPELYPARPILHNHFRLSKNGQPLLVTQMYFQGQGEGYDSSGSRLLQSVAIEQDESGARSVVFDIIVNVAGDNSTTCLDEFPTETQLPTSLSPSATPLSAQSEMPTGNFTIFPTVMATSEPPNIEPSSMPTASKTENIIEMPPSGNSDSIAREDASSSSTKLVFVAFMGFVIASLVLVQ